MGLRRTGGRSGVEHRGSGSGLDRGEPLGRGPVGATGEAHGCRGGSRGAVAGRCGVVAAAGQRMRDAVAPCSGRGRRPDTGADGTRRPDEDHFGGWAGSGRPLRRKRAVGKDVRRCRGGGHHQGRALARGGWRRRAEHMPCVRLRVAGLGRLAERTARRTGSGRRRAGRIPRGAEEQRTFGLQRPAGGRGGEAASHAAGRGVAGRKRRPPKRSAATAGRPRRTRPKCGASLGRRPTNCATSPPARATGAACATRR